MTLSAAEQNYLLSITAIKQRAQQIFALTQENKTNFQLHLEKLPALANDVVKIIQQHYPDGIIPLHSRWRHLETSGRALPELAQSQLDLAFISVLLDAGAGSVWRYNERGQIYSRSEGLALAILNLFLAGSFSSDPKNPWQADSAGLQKLNLSRLIAGFQVSDENPLVGLPNRLELLQRLGNLLSENPKVFPEGRPAGLIIYIQQTFGASLTANELFSLIVTHLSPIWPERTPQHAMGDVWFYPPLGWVPFHKLSLWLTLSLVEPLQTAHISIRELEYLPGLAEYRNGGLFIDGGVLTLKNAELYTQSHLPSSAIIIEWRALTLALLEKLAELIRNLLHKDAQSLPLVNILQGGTWEAGRQLALQQRPTGKQKGQPPLVCISDGTVF